LLAADEMALLESDETLSVGNFFCPLDFRTVGLGSLAAAMKIHEQAMANAYCSIAKAHTSIATTKYNYDVSLFKQNNQRTTWRTQAQVDQAKQVLNAAQAEENRKCSCKTGGSTAADQAKADEVSGYTRSSIDFTNYRTQDKDYCASDYPAVPIPQKPSSYPTSSFQVRNAFDATVRDAEQLQRERTNDQRFANTDCRLAYTTPRLAQDSFNRAYDRWVDTSRPYLKPSQTEMENERRALQNAINYQEKVCECKNAKQERAKLDAALNAVVAEKAKVETAAVAEVRAVANSQEMAEVKAQAEGYSSVQGKIDAWSKATAEADAAAKKSASAKAAEAAQRIAQATADANAKKAAAADAAAKAKADAQAKAVSEAKTAAEAKAAAEAQAAADKAATDVWRTEIATATKTVSSSATVTSVATATASGQGTGSATESASGSAAVAKSGASETASSTQSATDSKTATSTATQEASATESATESATATRTAPGTKVHHSCNA